VGRLALKYLLGLPIGFIGGDFRALALLAALVGYGILRRDRGEDERSRIRIDAPTATSCLLFWFLLPPSVLYAYSWLAHPIFGPARYTLFVAPAYLILVGRGLAKLPWFAAWLAGLIATLLSVALLPSLVFAPDRTADWRAAAATLARLDPSSREPVVIITADPTFDQSVIETARYYLGPRRPIFTLSSRQRVLDRPAARIWIAISLKGHHPIGVLPSTVRATASSVDFAGLRLVPASPDALLDWRVTQ
jgi:hypothetical protein